MSAQLRELEKRLERLTAEVDQEIHMLTERAIDLAASRAGKEDELLSLYEGLDRLGGEIAPSSRDDRVIADLLNRLSRARTSLELADWTPDHAD